jgi:hypothetical protein
VKFRVRILIVFFALMLYTCIKPYTPNLSGYTSLLVVDGLITNSDISNTVRLSRTFQQQNSSPSMVSDATVYITDDTENSFNLANKGNGIYKTDSLEFKGIPGRTYVLHVQTSDGEEYESDPCVMLPVPEIDSIYFQKYQQLFSNGTQTEAGIMIYLDSQEGPGNQYYRWSYDETWKFKVPYPKEFDYIKISGLPDNPVFRPVKDKKEFGWKSNRSGEILIRSNNVGLSEKILKQPVSFIPTTQTDRLLIQYSILVKQYSVSKREYDFWNNLKQVNEAGGDIFATQPYSVISNIHSVINSNKRVLGYFQVSAVSEKRKYILYRDVALMDLHFYSYPCRTWGYSPADFQTMCQTCPPKTWDDVMWYLTIASDYIFIKPSYSGPAQTGSGLSGLVFTRLECSTCEATGTSEKPSFWIDLK